MNRYKLRKAWPVFLIALLIAVFFWKFFFKSWLPIPADTIVGLYHPWRDSLSEQYPNGVAFKNFLVTDPVRQQYPWRYLAIENFKDDRLPVWNPYSFAGTPLLANFQTAVFYPFNVIFLILPFNFAWGILIFLQPLLAGIFLYLYLRSLKLEEISCFLGALCFSFSGFMIAWLEWGTIGHVVLWLPLVLLAIDRIIDTFQSQKISNFKFLISNSNVLFWEITLIFSLVCSFFAGHLQTAFYLVLFSLIYLIWKLFQIKVNRKKLVLLFTVYCLLFTVLTSIQWLPTLQFIKLSGRELDQVDWQQSGWFIPWEHLVQFLVPDFFGNPTTLNYWGEWNYGEFIGYLGVIPLILGVWGILRNRVNKGNKVRKEITFFCLIGLIFLSFALPTPWAKLPYRLKIPLLSTSQPTRLIFLVDFCLSVLAAFGMDRLLTDVMSKKKTEKLEKIWGYRKYGLLGIFGLIFVLLWFFLFFASNLWPDSGWLANLAVSKRNLILPTGLFLAFSGLIISSFFFKKFFKENSLITSVKDGLSSGRNYCLLITSSVIVLLTAFDLFRFGWKFTPFVNENWLFPTTNTIEFLKNDPEIYRIMCTDRRLFPPNFSVFYKIQTVDGYDPLYLQRYGELIAASERGEPNILPPLGFNRIITPHNYGSKIMDLLNVKYVLSLKEEDSSKLIKVFQEGETRVYKNNDYLPRAFMVYDARIASSKQEAINYLFDQKVDLRKTVVLEEPIKFHLTEGQSEVRISEYQENNLVLRVETDQSGILILSDSFYPGWKAFIDNRETKIIRADYNLRAIEVSSGGHNIRFSYQP